MAGAVAGRPRRAQESIHYPPRPALSKLAQTRRLMVGDPFLFLAELRAQLGDIFALEMMGLGKMVFLCSAELLHQVYRMPEEDIVAGEIRHKQVGYLVGKGASINLDGQAYVERRRVVTPFFSPRSVGRWTGTIAELTRDVVASWPEDRAFSLQPSFNEISLRTISRVLFGPLEKASVRRLMRLSERYLDAFRSPFVQMQPFQWKLFGLSPWGRFQALRAELYAALAAELDQRRAAGGDIAEAEDLASGLLAATPDLEAEGAREAIVHELVGFVVGGAESTAKAFGWSLLGILKTPGVLERLQAEVDEVLGDRPIEAEDVARLPYLDATILEGLRYQPAGPFAGPRLVKKPLRIGGYDIPPGTVVVQCLREVGRSDVFPYPEEFNPENFYSRDVKLKDWVPFGGGSRTCTGMGLARLELAVVLATILQNVELELAPGPTTPHRTGFLFEPKNGVAVRARRR